ncbi:FlgO family outer membrane protein [Glaciecola sp. 1036]|uniref:FlgO family outer membrane protein n=1 Tax=Alteromonadaceae TaxID=72275 RepID=UPI003D032482
MQKMRSFLKVVALVGTSVYLSGCAVSEMLTAGYTPPRKIGDFLAQEYGLAGELPPELQNNNNEARNTISLDNYKGDIVISDNTEQVPVDVGISMHANLYRPSFTFKGVEDYAAQLSRKLVKNAVGLSSDLKIGVSSFVVLDETLQSTSILGNQLSEYLISEMQSYGLAVIDHKLMPALKVTSWGDIAFSRNIIELSNHRLMDYVLTGTMIEKPNGVFVNARIISVSTNQVIASAQGLIPDFVVASIERQLVRR